MKVERVRTGELLGTMKRSRISTDENVRKLRKDLASFYEEKDFLACENMGSIVELSLEMLVRKPDLYKDQF